jgi:diketogulonate reductase-like aldo/keto reductase
MYADGEAEGLLGRALSNGRRHQVMVVTKLHPWDADKVGTKVECEGSLKRMGIDHIDLYLVHWRGPLPLDETVKALEDLKTSGKIGEWGVSNFDKQDVLELLKFRNSQSPLVNQILFNPHRREAEERLLNARLGDIVLMGYSPFERDRPFAQEPFIKIAESYEVDWHAIVLAWIRSRGILPIFKSCSKDHIIKNIVSSQFALTNSELAKINTFYPCPVNPPRIERDDTVSTV